MERKHQNKWSQKQRAIDMNQLKPKVTLVSWCSPLIHLSDCFMMEKETDSYFLHKCTMVSRFSGKAIAMSSAMILEARYISSCRYIHHHSIEMCTTVTLIHPRWQSCRSTSTHGIPNYFTSIDSFSPTLSLFLCRILQSTEAPRLEIQYNHRWI